MSRDYNAQYRRRYYHLGKLKQRIGCAECGYNSHPAALDWDHIDPSTKEFLIPRHTGRGNLVRLFKEIRKCRVICANCHRIHSRSQWNSGETYKTKERKIDMEV